MAKVTYEMGSGGLIQNSEGSVSFDNDFVVVSNPEGKEVIRIGARFVIRIVGGVK